MNEERPQGWMPVGVLSIVIGVLGVVSGVVVAIALGAMGPGAYAALKTLEVGVHAFIVFGSIMIFWAGVFGGIVQSLPLTIFLVCLVATIPVIAVIGGIGLALRANWGRVTVLVYAVMKLTLDVLTLVLLLILYGSLAVKSPYAAAWMVWGLAGTALLTLLSLVFPTTAIIVLSPPASTRVVRTGRTPSRTRPMTPLPVGPRIGGIGKARPQMVGAAASGTAGSEGPLNAGTRSRREASTRPLSPPGTAQRSARLVVLSGRNPHEEFQITLEDFQGHPVRNVIGTGSDCQVCLRGDPTISAHHAEIRMSDGHLCLFNLAATNAPLICRGLYNRFEVSGRQFLRDGDRIWLGSTELELHVSRFDRQDLGV